MVLEQSLTLDGSLYVLLNNVDDPLNEFDAGQFRGGGGGCLRPKGRLEEVTVLGDCNSVL